MGAKKGLRKIVVDGGTYYWKVREDEEYFYVKVLIVFSENGSCVLSHRYSLDTVTEGLCRSTYENRIPIITPAVVRSAILEERGFDLKRMILDQIKYKVSPNHWKRVKEIYLPEHIAGIGMDLEEEVLVCVCQIKIDLYRRMIIDLQTRNVLLEDMVFDVPKNKENKTYLPFGSLKREIPFIEWSHVARTVENQRGDRICCYSFYSQFIFFSQPVRIVCRLNLIKDV